MGVGGRGREGEWGQDHETMSINHNLLKRSEKRSTESTRPCQHLATAWPNPVHNFLTNSGTVFRLVFPLSAPGGRAWGAWGGGGWGEGGEWGQSHKAVSINHSYLQGNLNPLTTAGGSKQTHARSLACFPFNCHFRGTQPVHAYKQQTCL